jgi:ribosomal protein S18 acetylase RimI-like enzyme
MVGVSRSPLTSLDGLPSMNGLHPLDNAVWSSLTGPHAHFAEGAGLALRYPPDVSPFVAVPPLRQAPVSRRVRVPDRAITDAAAWEALAHLVGPDQIVALSGPPTLLDHLPAEWQVTMSGQGVQLVATDALVTRPDAEALILGEDDVAEMLDLVARTEPGPFLPRTYELGTYLGIRRNGALVAMAGERLHPPGWTEISAVCTDPAFRGQGLATRLVRAVAHGIRERGETPLMHAAVTNTNAIRLYTSIGFTERKRIGFCALRTPAL